MMDVLRVRKYVSVGSFLFYAGLVCFLRWFRLDAKVLSFSQDPKVRELAYEKTQKAKVLRLYLCSTLISYVNGLACMIMSTYLAYVYRNWKTYTPSRLLFGDGDDGKETDSPFLYLAVLSGYFGVDLILELLSLRWDWGMMLHHAITLLNCLHNLKHEVFAFPIIWLMFCEFSTPFSNSRWLLHTLGRKSSKLYVYNGVFLTLSFLVFRVVMYGLGFFHFVTVLYPTLLASDKPFTSKFVNPAGLATGYFLNLLWGTKIVKGLFALLSKTNQDATTTKKQS
jgi:hypothetical protein